MSETKWTPGSWFISRSSMGIHKYIEARIGGGMIQEIATCGPTEQHEQSDANANLIAVAPDLYAIVDTFDSYMAQAGEDAEQDSLNPIRALRWKAQQILAKARGES